MNITVEKNSIKKQLDNIHDEHLIKAISEMIKYAQSSKTDSLLKPFTKTEITKRALRSEKDIKEGKGTSLSKLKKEIKGW